jgi:ubiquinone/menaquinone biosynthesis C-methylase UbiE
MQQVTGNFGKLVHNYTSARPEYPREAIGLVLKSIAQPNPLILDLGCGTGISTRQLGKAGAIVFGCDADMTMLDAAIKEQSKNVSYVYGSAEKIPFSDQTFNAVTMFSAFHWFTTKKALAEIKRVLKPNGTVCIVQRRHQSPFRGDFRNIIEQTLKTKAAPKFNTKTEFVSFLKANGFSKVKKHVLPTINKYPLDQYLTLLQSYSIWNDVPKSKQTKILTATKKHFSSLLKNGYIHDLWDVEVIIAKM